MARWSMAVVVGLAVASFAAGAVAEDRSIGADKLQVRALGGGVRFLFVSHDPAFLFPPVGTPTSPDSFGMRVQIYSSLQGVSTAFLPGGDPGWKSMDGRIPRYRFDNPDAPGGSSLARRLQMRDQRLLRVRGYASFLDPQQPLGPSVVLVKIGSDRSCALFDAGTIRRDGSGSFVARDAVAGALPDCSDEAIAAALGIGCGGPGDSSCGGSCPGDGVCTFDISGVCQCVFPTDPCGATGPVCNGECPLGEECVSIATGFPINGCTCTPVGVTPCGASAFPNCEGACGGSSSCEPVIGKWGNYCSCGTPCGECPSPFVCVNNPIVFTGCAPLFCGGPYPTCGGGCAGGWECAPFTAPSVGFDDCACSPPATTCDDASGGLSCPAGEVCVFDLSGPRLCVAPPP